MRARPDGETESLALRTRNASCGSGTGSGGDGDGDRDGLGCRLSSVRADSAADEDAEERPCGRFEGVGGCGMRTQTIHHPRLVLQVRSSSCGRERVSMYVLRRRWWMARLSTRDQDGPFGRRDGEGEGVLGPRDGLVR